MERDKKEATLIDLIRTHEHTLDDLIALGATDGELTMLHRDPRVVKTVRGNTVVYRYRPPVVAQPMAHVEWCRDHYPWPGRDGVPPFEMPFPEIDFSWIFLKPDEMVEYSACQKGNPNQKYKRRFYDTSKSKASSHGVRTTSHSGTGGSTTGTGRIGLW